MAVWGPAGAPGRTTVAVAVAAELAARRRRTTLVDADPYGGAVAQQLGILDEVSGLLAAARLAGSGALEAKFGSVQRAVGEHLTVVTGLPRPDRWVEVRAGAVEHLLEVAAAHGDVVVDTGFSLESDPAASSAPARLATRPRSRPSRRPTRWWSSGRPTRWASPGWRGGWSTCGRWSPGRRSAWWSTGCGRRSAGPRRTSPAWSRASPGWWTCTSCPTTRPTVDRALVGGRTLVEVGESPIGRAVSALVDGLAPETVARARRGSGATGGGRSGREEQVEPADRESDHRDQQRQLTGDPVPLGQHARRPVVCGDDTDHVTQHHRDHLGRGQRVGW